MSAEADPVTGHEDRLAELRGSAKGWRGVQFAALGFIGLCGVIKPDESSNPEALQAISGSADPRRVRRGPAWGIYYVGKAAWPIYGSDPMPTAGADPAAVNRREPPAQARARAMTFVSIALTALAGDELLVGTD